MFPFLVQRKMNVSLTFSHSLSLAGVFKKAETSSSGSQFLPQGLRAQMSPSIHMEVPALSLGLKTDLCTSQRRLVLSLQKLGRGQPPIFLVSRSKASYFIVSGERKWKIKESKSQNEGKGETSHMECP